MGVRNVESVDGWGRGQNAETARAADASLLLSRAAATAQEARPPLSADSFFDCDHDVWGAGNIAQQEDIRPHGYALDSISNTIRASSIRGQDRARVGFDAMRKPRDIRVELWPEF